MANGDTKTADNPEVQDTELTDAQRAALAARTVATMDQVAASAVAPPRNRTFMGPNIGGPTDPQQFFGELPSGRTIMPPSMRNPAPLTPEAQAALQSRLAAPQPESDPEILARMQAQDRPGTRTIGVSRPPMPTWQDQYTVNGQTDVSGLAREAQLRQKAQGAMLMNDWYDKVQKVGIVAAGPPPDTRSASGWKPAAAQSQEKPVWMPANTATGEPAHWSTPRTIIKPPASRVATEKLNAADQKTVTMMDDERKMHEKMIAAGSDTDGSHARMANALRQQVLSIYQRAGIGKVPSEFTGVKSTATATTPSPASSVKAPARGKLGKDQARELLKQAGGDKDKARKLARDAGYEL